MYFILYISEKNDIFQQLESERAAASEAEEHFTRLGKPFSCIFFKYIFKFICINFCIK